MKRVRFLILGLLLLCLSACSSNKNGIDAGKKVDKVSFVYNNKTIELSKSMSGTEVYEILTNGIGNILPMNLEKAHQAEYKTISESKSVNRYTRDGQGNAKLTTSEERSDYIFSLTNYTNLYNNGMVQSSEETESTTFFEMTTEYNVKNDSSKNYNDYLNFYGKREYIDSNDEGYKEGSLSRHYKETVCYDSNIYDSRQKKETYTKYINDYEDMMNQQEPNIDSVRGYLQSFSNGGSYLRYISIPTIKCPYESMNDFIHYNYQLTNKYIIFNIHLDFSEYILNELYEIVMNLTEEEWLSVLNKEKAAGSFYEIEAYIDYNSIKNTDGTDRIYCDYLYYESCRITKESGVYTSDDVVNSSDIGKEYSFYDKLDRKLSCKSLNLTLSDVEKKKEKMLSSI